MSEDIQHIGQDIMEEDEKFKKKKRRSSWFLLLKEKMVKEIMKYCKCHK